MYNCENKYTYFFMWLGCIHFRSTCSLSVDMTSYLSFRLHAVRERPQGAGVEKSPKAKHCSNKYFTFLIVGFFDSVPIALRSE